MTRCDIVRRCVEDFLGFATRSNALVLMDEKGQPKAMSTVLPKLSQADESLNTRLPTHVHEVCKR